MQGGGLPSHARRKILPMSAKIKMGILAVVITLGVTAGVAYRRYVYPTGKILHDLYTVRTHNNGMPMGNFFLLQMGDKYVAFDAGGNSEETRSGLQRLGISAADVIAVFVTHAHWDHIGSLDVFSDAVIYTGNTENSSFPDTPHRLMMDGEVTELFGRYIKCFYTPGHTIDSVCFLVDGKYLFVGDLFITTNDSPFEARYNKELQLRYRKQMLELDGVEHVFTGHFGLFSNPGYFRFRY